METVVISQEATLPEEPVTLGSLLREYEQLNSIKHPLSYLKEDEIVRLTKEDRDIVRMRRKKAGYTWSYGHPTKEFQNTRKTVLELLKKGAIPYDLQVFTKGNRCTNDI